MLVVLLLPVVLLLLVMVLLVMVMLVMVLLDCLHVAGRPVRQTADRQLDFLSLGGGEEKNIIDPSIIRADNL